MQSVVAGILLLCGYEAGTQMIASYITVECYCLCGWGINHCASAVPDMYIINSFILQ